MAGVVTISASFGAGGSLVGPLVADRLGLPFLDRAIPEEVARSLALTEEAAVGLDERGPTVLDRMARSLARAAAPIGPEAVSAGPADDPAAYRVATEAVLRRVADTTGAVVLGRCAMVVLGDRPDVLTVRLDGPEEDRVARVMAADSVDDDAARRLLRQSDRAREAYAKTFYRVSQRDPRLYHLVIDTTVLGIETAAAIVIEAAQVRLGR